MNRVIWGSTGNAPQGLFIIVNKLMRYPCDMLAITESTPRGKAGIVVNTRVGDNLGCALDFATTGISNGEVYQWFVDRYKNLIAEAEWRGFQTRTYYRAWRAGVTPEEKERFRDKVESMPCYNGTYVSRFTTSIGGVLLEKLSEGSRV